MILTIMPTKFNSSNTFQAGMNKDVNPKFQPKGTYRFALNAVLEVKEGLQGSILNEIGNTFCQVIHDESGATIVGHVLTDTRDIVLFLAFHSGNSAIATWNPDTCEYTELLKGNCLNFSTKHPVFAQFRIRGGCDRVIYFTDKHNPYRVFNLDQLNRYKDSDGDVDCDRLLYSRNVERPCINVDRINEGGGLLPIGAYQVAVQYLDEELNPTNYFYITDALYLADESLNSLNEEIDGGFNIVDPDANILGGVPLANKSITWSLSDLDTNFSYYKLAILVSESATGSLSSAYETDEQTISGTEDFYTLSNLEDINFTSIDNVIVDRPAINKVTDHAQLDNRLWLAGTMNDGYDWAKVQQAANTITSKWTTDTVPTRETKRFPEYQVKLRNYMRDEVYAFSIWGVFANGTRTPAFHIPGRETMVNPGIGDETDNYRTSVPAGANWDTYPVTIGGLNAYNKSNSIASLEDVKHLGYEASDIGETIDRWRIYNTATYDDFERTEGEMAYYECNTRYPDLKDCSGDFIFPTTTIDGEIVPANVRHHKFPDTKTSPLFRAGDLDALACLGIKFDLSQFLADVGDIEVEG